MEVKCNCNGAIENIERKEGQDWNLKIRKGNCVVSLCNSIVVSDTVTPLTVI